MKKNNMQRQSILLVIYTAIVLIFMGISQAFAWGKGGENRPSVDSEKHSEQSFLIERATVDAVNKHGTALVADDQYMNIPKGAPNLQPGDVIEIQIDRKSGKIVKINKVGIRMENRKHATDNGKKTGNPKGSKAAHGQIRKMNGKWQNY